MPVLTSILPIAATSGTTSTGGAGSMLPTILMVVAMIAIFYLLLIRPENKKKKAANEMRSSLKPGDEITTIGGIVGTICAVKEETIVIETGADRVRIEFTKWAVSSKGTQGTQDAAPAPEKKEKDKKDDSGKEK